jgi:hypothetical protein
MKSQAAFEFTVRKMLRGEARLYFWTFTFKEVHSLKEAMGLWNQFLTLLKRKLKFRGVRVLELHEEHGCHFHVLTNKRYSVRTILTFSKRYGFGRLNVKLVGDTARATKYLCKYLSKRRPNCLRRARLWSAFGDIEPTKVKDVLTDTPMSKLIRVIMGKPSVEDELLGRAAKLSIGFRPEPKFQRAVEKARIAYIAGLDPEYFECQAIWDKVRGSGLVPLSHLWEAKTISEEVE